jgi:hypothetical protein
MNNYAILLECDPGNTLGGSCTRDIKNMASYLIEYCNFLPSNIYLLSTNNKIGWSNINGVIYSQSTQLFDIFNIINEKNPSLFVMLISGHGYIFNDNNNDEIDGHDEAIKISSNKFIIDDDIYNNIISKLKCNALLFADTCHSGTMFDLPFIYNGFKWINNSNRNDSFKNNKIISFSACSDNQLSMCDIGDMTGFGGSLTTAILNSPNVFNNIINLKITHKLFNDINKRLLTLGQNLIISTNLQSFSLS